MHWRVHVSFIHDTPSNAFQAEKAQFTPQFRDFNRAMRKWLALRVTRQEGLHNKTHQPRWEHLVIPVYSFFCTKIKAAQRTVLVMLMCFVMNDNLHLFWQVDADRKGCCANLPSLPPRLTNHSTSC